MLKYQYDNGASNMAKQPFNSRLVQNPKAGKLVAQKERNYQRPSATVATADTLGLFILQSTRLESLQSI